MSTSEKNLIQAALRDAGELSPGGSSGGLGSGSRTMPSLPIDSFPGYDLVREIHRGGQGVVYLAIQEATRRRVAIKVMRGGPLASERERARFEREVHILGQLNHRNIVAIHDSGQGLGGTHYYVMDYISGRPLNAFIAGTDRTIEENLKLFATICSAVHAAHLRGIIHRDLKPGNIRVDANGEPFILDFGLAKVTLGEGSGSADPGVLSITGQFVGSLPWASPEQAEGVSDRLDIRTDVYSLGVVLYKMLTGRFPYDVVGNMQDVLNNILRTEPTPPSTIRRKINDEVETIVLKCLAKDRERRYQSAGELSKDIRHYLAGEPIEAKRDSGWYVMRKTMRRFKLPIAVGAAFLVVLVVATITSGMFWRGAVADRDQALDANARLQRALYSTRIALTENVYDDNDTDRMGVLLDACPPALRRWEWDYFSWAANRAVLKVAAHGWAVTDLAVSRDGRHIVTCGWNNVPVLWNRQTGEKLHELRGHADWAHSVAMSPDGTRIATGSRDKTIKIWDAATGEVLLTLLGHTGSVDALAFSPNGRRLASTGDDTTIRVWNTDTGATMLTLVGHDRTINDVIYSPDGSLLASAGWDHSLRLWDAITGDPLAVVRAHDASVTAVAFSPDGLHLATGGLDRTWRTWSLVADSPTGPWGLKLERTITAYDDPIYAVAYGPHGQYVFTGGQDKTVRGWDAATGEEMLVLRGVSGPVYAVASTPDGQHIVAGGLGKRLNIWDRAAGEETFTLRGHRHWVSAVSWSADGSRLASSSDDGTIRVWDADTGETLLRLHGHRSNVTCVALSADGTRLVSGGQDKTVRMWDAITGDLLWTGTAPTERVRDVAFIPDGMGVVSASDDGVVRQWDALTGVVVRTFAGMTDQATCLSISADGQRLACGSADQTVRIWDLGTTDAPLILQRHAHPIESVAFDATGNRLVSTSSETVLVWDLPATGNAVPDPIPLSGHAGQFHHAVFSPDGTRIASAIWSTIVLWDAHDGRQVATLRGHRGTVTCLAFDPDGRRLASASADQTVKVWETGVPTGGFPARLAHTDARLFVNALFRQYRTADAMHRAAGVAPILIETARTIADRLIEKRLARAARLDEDCWTIVSVPGEHIQSYFHARRLAHDAMRLRPGEPLYAASLGAAQFRLGKHEAALTRLNEVQAADPPRMAVLSVVLAFRAMTLARLDRGEDARADFERLRALAARPDFEGMRLTDGLMREVEEAVTPDG